MLIERQWFRVLGFLVLSIVLLALLTCTIFFPTYYMVYQVTKLPDAPVLSDEVIFEINNNVDYDNTYLTKGFYDKYEDWFTTNISFNAYDPQEIELTRDETIVLDNGTYYNTNIPDYSVPDFSEYSEINIEVNNSIFILCNPNGYYYGMQILSHGISKINITANNSIIYYQVIDNGLDYVPITANNSLIISSDPMHHDYNFDNFKNSIYLIDANQYNEYTRGEKVGDNSFVDLIETTE